MTKARFREGDPVIRKSSRDGVGKVVAEPIFDQGEWWYKVQFTKRRQTIVEDDLDPFEADDQDLEGLLLRGKWGRIEAFRRALAAERIRTQNRSTVYSFNSQRILFQPHQYKPLLNLLDSVDRRVLIADEVARRSKRVLSSRSSRRGTR